MLMRHVHPKLQFTHMLPYGAILHDNGVQFVVFSRSAKEMRLLLYDEVEDSEPTEIISFERETDRWGETMSVEEATEMQTLLDAPAGSPGKLRVDPLPLPEGRFLSDATLSRLDQRLDQLAGSLDFRDRSTSLSRKDYVRRCRPSHD